MLDACLLPTLGGPALPSTLCPRSERVVAPGLNPNAVKLCQLARTGGHCLLSSSNHAINLNESHRSAGNAAIHHKIGGYRHQKRLLTHEQTRVQSIARRVGCLGALRQQTTSDIDHSKHICRSLSALRLKEVLTRRVKVQTAPNDRAASIGRMNSTRARDVMTSAMQSPTTSNARREIDQPKPQIAVIATDVDGTLLDSKQQLRGETVAALKAAMAQGIQVLIATGKARGPWIDTVLPRLGLTTPGVYMQGLILCDGDGSIQYERCMDEDVARKVIRLGMDENVTVTAYCGNRILCAERDKHTDRLIGYGEPVPEAMGSLLDMVGKIPINKLLYMGEQSAIDSIRPQVQAALGGIATLVTALNGMLEVLPPGASKGLGLTMVLERMGVDARHVLAIGDGENDIEMLRLAGTSVAMGNAGADVKAAAQFVTSSNDEDGLALAVECFVLGGLESGRCRVGEGGRIEVVERVEVMR